MKQLQFLFKGNFLGKGVREENIFRNIVIVVSGTAIARVIGVITTPLITRIYKPEHFGLVSAFVSLATILTPFATLRYSMAIPLVKSDRSVVNLTILCVLLLFLVAGIIGVVFLYFAPIILKTFNIEILLPYWWLLIFMFLGTGLYEVFNQLAIYEKAFKPLANTRVWQSISASIIKIGLGFLGIKPLGLLLGEIAHRTIGSIYLGIIFYKKFKSYLKTVRKKYFLFFFRYYAEFPMYRLPSQFLLTLSARSLLLFSVWFFGPKVAGHVGFAISILGWPIDLIGQAISNAFYAEIAKVGNKQPREIYKISKAVLLRLLFFSMPFFLIFLFTGPSIFSWIFGENWREAGIYASILSIFFLFRFIFSPLANILNVFRKQKIFLALNILRLGIISLVFLIIYFFNLRPVIGITLYSIGMCGYYACIFITVFSIIKKRVKNPKLT